MSVFKKINQSDVNITPFNVHKNYTINSTNYSGSNCGYGIGILAANYHSYSFGDSVKGKPISQEEKNPNGTYKSIIYDSIKHLYYSRVDNPSENFGGNRPEKESRLLWEKAHVISIPSPIYDLKIKSGSLHFTDHYFESLAIHKQKDHSSSVYHTPTLYYNPPILANQYKFESSQSKFIDSSEFSSVISDARSSTVSRIKIITGSSNNIYNDPQTAKVGTGSILFQVTDVDTIDSIQYNVGNGLLIRDAEDFEGITNNDWWEQPNLGSNLNEQFGMPAYTVTMWVNPMKWDSKGVTGAPGQSTLVTRDKNSYFELNILTSSMSESRFNPKGIVPLQMFFGATGSNCTTTESRQAVAEGFGLATGSWNLVSITQEFNPGDVTAGTSGSQWEQLPPWGTAAKTTLRIYRPDPIPESGFTYIKKVGYATASTIDNDGPGNIGPDWTNLLTRYVTSSVQYNRHMYVGASGSVAVGAANNDATAKTLYNAFTGSMDDIRIYESALDDTQVANLYHNCEMDLSRTPPVTASFVLKDDGFGNLLDTQIVTSSFAKENKLVGYYGFNDQYTVLNAVSKSGDLGKHNGNGYLRIKDYSKYKNTANSNKVKFVPGIAVMQQSGSIRNATSINYYHTDVPTGVRAQFNNSGSIRIPHHNKLNLSGDEFTISFWIKIPENQIPGINTLTNEVAYSTTGESGDAGGTSEPCTNIQSGSSAGRDYVTLITKSGLGKKTLTNAATNIKFDELVQGKEMQRVFPYHIQLKNTSLEKDGLPFEPGNNCPLGSQLNTIVVRRTDGSKKTILESTIPIVPLVDNHIVLTKTNDTIELWINGRKDKIVPDTLKCTDNISDIFIGDEGTAWATGSNPSLSTTKPVNPFSGSLDELRFYEYTLAEDEILSLYDNNLVTPSAYQTNVVGNTIYEHGIVTFTNNLLPKYFSGSLHLGTAVVGNTNNALFSSNFELKLKNTRELYEQNIKCHVKASDFNLTTNPTARKTINGQCKEVLSVQELADFAKDPSFNPYVSTIGLYDDFGRLLAVSKLARPLQKLKNVDMTFVIRFDR